MTTRLAASLDDTQPNPGDVVRYERFRPLLVRFFQRRLPVACDAEDLAQEVMIRLVRKGPGLELRQPEAYLFHVAANVLRDQYRADTARRRDQHESFDEATPVGESPSAEQVYGDREMLERMVAALTELTPKCRTVFLLHRYEGLGYREIARRLGVGQSAIEKHIMHAMRHLHKRLNDD